MSNTTPPPEGSANPTHPSYPDYLEWLAGMLHNGGDYGKDAARCLLAYSKEKRPGVPTAVANLFEAWDFGQFSDIPMPQYLRFVFNTAMAELHASTYGPRVSDVGMLMELETPPDPDAVDREVKMEQTRTKVCKGPGCRSTDGTGHSQACMQLHDESCKAGDSGYAPLTDTEVADLTSMVYGAPWSPTLCKELKAILRQYDKLRSNNARPSDPSNSDQNVGASDLLYWASQSPPWATMVATDMDGSVWAYECTPVRGTAEWAAVQGRSRNLRPAWDTGRIPAWSELVMSIPKRPETLDFGVWLKENGSVKPSLAAYNVFLSEAGGSVETF